MIQEARLQVGLLYGRPALPFWCCGPLSDVEIYCGPQTFLPNLNTNQLLVYVRIYILHKKQIYLHKINQGNNYWLMSHLTLFFSY